MFTIEEALKLTLSPTRSDCAPVVQSSVSGDRFVRTPAVSPPSATQDSQVFKSKGIPSAHGLVCCLQGAGSSWCCLSLTLAAKLPFPFQFVSSKWVLFCFCQSFLFFNQLFLFMFPSAVWSPIFV